MFVLLLFICRSDVLILGIWVGVWLVSQVQRLQICSRNNVLDRFSMWRWQRGWLELQHVWAQLAYTHPISPSLAGLEECYRSSFKIKQQRFCSERWEKKRKASLPLGYGCFSIFSSVTLSTLRNKSVLVHKQNSGFQHLRLLRMLPMLKSVRNMPVEEKWLSQLKQISPRQTGLLVAAPHYWPWTRCLCLCLPQGQVILLGWFEQSTNNLLNLCLHSEGGE